MSELWLVRHGSTAWTGRRWCGTTDLPLDATGRRQAASLARALAGMLAVPVTLIASPQARAIQTAEKVAKSLRCDYRVDPRLREIDFGVAEGLSWDELERDLPGVAVEILGGATVIGWPGGETRVGVRRRAEDVWAKLEDLRAPSVVLVTHGGFIRALLATRDIVVPTTAPASAIGLQHQGDRWVQYKLVEAPRRRAPDQVNHGGGAPTSDLTPTQS